MSSLLKNPLANDRLCKPLISKAQVLTESLSLIGFVADAPDIAANFGFLFQSGWPFQDPIAHRGIRRNSLSLCHSFSSFGSKRRGKRFILRIASSKTRTIVLPLLPVVIHPRTHSSSPLGYDTIGKYIVSRPSTHQQPRESRDRFPCIL